MSLSKTISATQLLSTAYITYVLLEINMSYFFSLLP
jgi:hypothetical protein